MGHTPLPDDDEEETDRDAPIGVGRDYTVERPTSRGGMSADAAEQYDPITSVKPRYWKGDEWSTPRGLSSEDRAALQLLMKQLGFIDPKARIVLGEWDQKSATAFKNVLAWANVNGTDWTVALSAMAKSAEQYPPDIEERAPLVSRVSNPDELKAALRETLKAKLGTGDAVDEAGLDRMVAAYQQKEKAFQQQAYNADETGGTIVEPPSFDTFADVKAKAADPTAYDSRKVVEAAEVVKQMLAGGL